MNESKVLVAPKEMKYSIEGSSSEILYLEMSEDGYGICIVNCCHDYPCGYVTFPGIDKVEDYDNFYVKNAMVHGGFTFLGKLNPDLWKVLEPFRWIGWDYAHSGDYSPFGLDSDERKWTTEEVLAEARAIMEDIRAGEYENDCRYSYVEVEENEEDNDFFVESENPDVTYIKDEIEKLEKFYERVSSTMSNYERIMVKTALLELKLKTV